MTVHYHRTSTQSFEYTVKRQRRKTMALHIMPDASIEVRIPGWVPKREWLKFVEERAHWVIRQQRIALEKLALQPGYWPGQRHHYLGQLYPLKINYGARSWVQLQDNCLHLQIRDPDNPAQVQKALEQWYRTQARSVFDERINACYALFPASFQDQYALPAITLRRMRRRWGSCSLKGEITLNVQLIKMPVPCIDYVVVHELCHLAVFNHSRTFYQLMSQVMPDWKRRKQLLEAWP